MSRVVHFEIQADDLERAKRFYETVFGWEFEDYGHFTGSPYWGVLTGPESEAGIDGGLMPRPAPAQSPGHGVAAFICTIGVESFDETAAKVLAAGGQVASPKVALTGMAWQGYFLDTEGNTFGVHQPDPEAR